MVSLINNNSLYIVQLTCQYSAEYKLYSSDKLQQPVSAKLRYTDTGYGHVVQYHQRTSSQLFYNLLYNKFATSQCQRPTSRHVKMLGCGKFLSVGGEFVVQQVVELLWARPLVVLYNMSVAGVRAVVWHLPVSADRTMYSTRTVTVKTVWTRNVLDRQTYQPPRTIRNFCIRILFRIRGTLDHVLNHIAIKI